MNQRITWASVLGLALGLAPVATGCGGSESGTTGGDGGSSGTHGHGGSNPGATSSTGHHADSASVATTGSGGHGAGTTVSAGGGPAGSGGAAATVGAGGDPSTSSSSSSSSTGGTTACPVFPASNPWNQPVDGMAVDPKSDAYVAFINDNGGDGPLHADFDAVGDGIPFAFVDSSTPKVGVTFDYDDESDPGPYPIPANPPIESGGDHHILLVDTSACKLYEMWNSRKSGGAWKAGSGAIFDLNTGALRPDCWTSADAAGLPIYPGLVRYAEVQSGVINHALRFTIDTSQRAWINPARHQAGSSNSSSAPPMGLRLRLKNNAHVNQIIANAAPQPKVVLTALQKYGMFLADNGSNWFVSGEPNASWDDDGFHAAFDKLHGGNFDAGAGEPNNGDFEVVSSVHALEQQTPQNCP